MRLEALRSAVLEANLELVRRGLVLYTFGNASGIDRESGLVAIKPSGVPYEELKPADLVVTDLDGKIVEGTCGPPPTWPPTCCSIGRFPPSAAWCTPIPSLPPHGPRPAGRFPPTAPPTRITSMGPSR